MRVGTWEPAGGGPSERGRGRRSPPRTPKALASTGRYAVMNEGTKIALMILGLIVAAHIGYVIWVYLFVTF